MSDLRPMLDRGRYSDEEWEFASAGICDWETANYPSLQRCGQPSDPGSFYRYCAKHDEDARDHSPDTYGR